MKDIFFVGDFKTNTGPANVNKNIKKILGKEKYCYSESSSKIGRMFELIYKVALSTNICFCSFSRLDILGIKICKLLRKKTSYIMHGYIKKEQEINGEKTADVQNENYILNNVNKIICVSKLCCDYIKKENYNADIYYIYNNIPDKLPRNHTHSSKERKVIMSTGGLLPLKNNYKVCMAIEKINATTNENLEYLILGNSHGKQSVLKKFKFVKYYESLPHDKCLELMQKSYLYIQNSKFETFGLSVVEALFNGCNILISKNVGAIGIFNKITSNSVIENVDDIDEIESKIKYILKNPNNKLINEIDINNLCMKTQIKKLVKIICS